MGAVGLAGRAPLSEAGEVQNKQTKTDKENQTPQGGGGGASTRSPEAREAGSAWPPPCPPHQVSYPGLTAPPGPWGSGAQTPLGTGALTSLRPEQRALSPEEQLRL